MHLLRWDWGKILFTVHQVRLTKFSLPFLQKLSNHWIFLQNSSMSLAQARRLLTLYPSQNKSDFGLSIKNKASHLRDWFCFFAQYT